MSLTWAELSQMCSMLYWWDKIKDLPIPKPKTIIIPIPDEVVDYIFKCYDDQDEACSKSPESYHEFVKVLKQEARKLGFPLFMRSDQTSCKFFKLGDKPLYRIDNEKELGRFWILIAECHEMTSIGVFEAPRPKAIILREWLDIDCLYELKINNRVWRRLTIEVRVMVKDGEVEQYFPYWHKEVIEREWQWLIPDQIREQEMSKLWKAYEEYVKILENEKETFLNYAKQIAKTLDGYWSVDFARVKSTWYLIDMARGELSWKPSS